MGTFSSSRAFQIWDFHISLGQLLIRSARDERDANSKNIDLIFGGVFYMDTAATLSGIEISTPTEEELTMLEIRGGFKQDPGGKHHKYFVLQSDGVRYYIGAMYWLVEENTLHLMETSLGKAYQIAE